MKKFQSVILIGIIIVYSIMLALFLVGIYQPSRFFITTMFLIVILQCLTSFLYLKVIKIYKHLTDDLKEIISSLVSDIHKTFDKSKE